jgi:hypothetical protein
LEPGEKQDMLKRKQQESYSLDKSIEETAASIIESFTPRKKELLAAAIDNGLDAVTHRI